MSGRKMKIIGIMVLGGGLLAGAAAWAAGDDNCEPARWLGKKVAMGPGSGPGMGMMRRGSGMGMGMMRKRMMEEHNKEHAAGGPMRGNFIRHREVMMGGGIPKPYAGMTSPLPVTKENIAAGKALFEDNCASCHGKSGQGDGEAGKELNPRPADITHILGKPLDRDDFFMWTISEGGEKLKTDMPAFKDVLSEKERWQVIQYLRNGLGG